MNSESNHQLWNRVVNSKWPSNMPVPTDQEALSGARRLYKKATGKRWTGKVKITRGNRHTWIRWDGDVDGSRRNQVDTLFVNPNKFGRGWREIVHSIAHLAHHELNYNDRPHTHKQLYIERDLTDFVLASGWLNGKLKAPAKAKPDVIAIRYNRMLARKINWTKKLKRAQNAVRKIDKEIKDYERRHADRVVK